MNYSKKIIKQLVCIVFISIAAFSCSSDDDSGDSGTTAQNKANIIGSWSFTSSTTNGNADEINACELMDTATFTSSQVTFTYFEGDNCADTGSDTLSYSIDGDDITISIDGEEYTSEIITLNSSTLTIRDTEENGETGETYTYTETYTKQ